MTYLEEYQKELKSNKAFKERVMADVVSAIKSIATYGPLHIGNMVYYYIKHNGRDVPAYCYEAQYRNGCKFMPIYDEDCTCEFGWSAFVDCCRIFDVIKRQVAIVK